MSFTAKDCAAGFNFVGARTIAHSIQSPSLFLSSVTARSAPSITFGRCLSYFVHLVYSMSDVGHICIRKRNRFLFRVVHKPGSIGTKWHAYALAEQLKNRPDHYHATVVVYFT